MWALILGLVLTLVGFGAALYATARAMRNLLGPEPFEQKAHAHVKLMLFDAMCGGVGFTGLLLPLAFFTGRT